MKMVVTWTTWLVTVVATGVVDGDGVDVATKGGGGGLSHHRRWRW